MVTCSLVPFFPLSAAYLAVCFEEHPIFYDPPLLHKSTYLQPSTSHAYKMRPGVSLDSNAAEPSRPRKSSIVDASSLTGDRDRCNNTPTTFFLTRDPEGASGPPHVERGLAAASYNSPLSSLHDTIQEVDRPLKHVAPRSADAPARSSSRRRSTIKPGTADRYIRRGSSNASINPELNPTPLPQPALSDAEQKRAATPSPLPSRDVSLPSSPKSRSSRQSLSKSSSPSDDDLLTSADETGSQAILSSGEEDDNEAASERRTGSCTLQSLEVGVQDSQPELVMPSIKMPSRRPFTQRGKGLGRFKIMVAGRKGTFPPDSSYGNMLSISFRQDRVRPLLSSLSSNCVKTLSTSTPLPQRVPPIRQTEAEVQRTKSMLPQNPIQNGGRPWRSLAYSAGESPWETLYWNGTSASSIHLTRLT